MKTLVIIYRSLFVGGIEKYIIDMMNNAIQNGNRVIWICHKDMKYSNLYESTINKIEIKCFDFSQINILKVPQLNIAVNEELYVMAFDVFRLYVGYGIRKKYSNNNVRVFFAIPHFTGSTIFPEQSLTFPFKQVVKRFYRYLYKINYKNDSLLFFAKKHIDAIQDNYKIQLPNAVDKVVPEITQRIPFDENRVRTIFKSEKFIIISPGRFDFPHKGYLLGLIKTFGTMKQSFPNMYLKIVGDGPDRKSVVEAINALPKEIQSSVELHEPISSDELIKEMSNCNLNISVAGCCSLGARNGIVSIPARHYCYECEVYGFFPNCKTKTTSSEPGTPVEDYILKVLKMSEDEYVDCARNAYNTFNDNKSDTAFPFRMPCNTKYIPNKILFTSILLVFSLQRIFTHLKIKKENV